MKLTTIVSGAVVLGCVVGVSGAWGKYGFATPSFTLSSKPAPSVKPVVSGDHDAKAVFDTQEHDFGTLAKDEWGSHAFHLTNEGKGILGLKPAGTSCAKCTIAKLDKTTLGPGESTDIVVQYHATLDIPDFHQSAKIQLTGDPNRDLIELGVSGKIAQNYELMPGEIVFAKAASGEESSTDVRLISRVAENLKVLKHELKEPASAESFRVEIIPMTAADLEKEGAKSGETIRVTLLPGLPLGNVKQSLRLNINLGKDKDHELEIPIHANVTSDLGIIGQHFDAERMVFNMGIVKASQGAKRTIYLIVRGPNRQEVKLPADQIKIDPTGSLTVTVGEPVEVQGGAAIKYPLVLEIPAGSPVVSHLGGGQGTPCQVTLGTTHPVTKEVNFSVIYAAER